MRDRLKMRERSIPKVLVTGGSGFIGSRIAQNCLAAGLRVRVFDLAKSANQNISESLIGSILDPYEISVAARGCDYIVHTAAALGVERTESRRLECLYINIQGTINVLEAAVKERVSKVLFTSSSEVYGDGVGPLDECAVLNPKSNYAITKLVGEEYLRAYHQTYGLDYTIVRLFNVYGPGQTENFVIPKFHQLILNGVPPVIYGDGNQVRAFCHVEDAARGIVLALLSKDAHSQIFNIGNPSEPVTVLELAEKMIELGGNSLRPKFVGFEESDRGAHREIYRRIPSIEKARRAFGYEPVIGLEQGLLETFREKPMVVGVL